MPATSRTAAAARRRRTRALKDVRQRLLLDAAKAVFTRDGLEGASMRSIATEAGCTTGAIYPQFDSKEALYAAVLSESLAALEQQVSSAINAESDARSAALAGLQAFFDYYRGEPADLSLGLYLFGGMRRTGLNAPLDKALNAQLARIFALIEGAFARAGEPDGKARTASGIAQATGLLILDQTGRMRLFGKKADTLFAEFLASC